MKKFELPVMTVVAFEADDIICTSGCATFCPEYGAGTDSIVLLDGSVQERAGG